MSADVTSQLVVAGEVRKRPFGVGVVTRQHGGGRGHRGDEHRLARQPQQGHVEITDEVNALADDSGDDAERPGGCDVESPSRRGRLSLRGGGG